MCLSRYPSNHKGYRSLDLSTNKIIISRHVIFDQTYFPFYEGSILPSSDFDFLEEFDVAPVSAIGSHVSGSLAATVVSRIAAPVGRVGHSVYAVITIW